MTQGGPRAATIRRALSVGVAPSLYGVSFGALAVANGLTVWQACATSLLLFSGGSQFALVGILGGGGSAASAITTSSLLAARNAIYGLQLKPILRPRGLWRVPVAQVTIDESSAVALTQPDEPLARLGFWITGATIFLVWNATTLLGALAGDALGDPKSYGLDAAAGAAFLGLLWPRLAGREPVAVAVVSALVAATVVPVVPVGVPVLAAGVVAVAWGLARGASGDARP